MVSQQGQGHLRAATCTHSHFVERVLALEWRRGNVGTGNANTEAHLVGRDVVHPLLVKDVSLAVGNVGGDIATDGVAHVGRAVRVEFSTQVTWCHVDLGKVTERHDLDIEWRLDKVHGSERSVRLRR